MRDRNNIESTVTGETPRTAAGDGPVPDSARDLGIVSVSPGMRQLADMTLRVALADSPVLITGESGSGKERIARLLHAESKRAAKPLIVVDCGAIAETLLEAELFGYARGTFADATQERAGHFEAANGGMLLLDDVGEVSLGMQDKLLRVLRAHEVRRMGETQGRKIDVRVVVATPRDLASAVAAGTFRQDLYYRLKVVELHVPPLRERREDLLPLAQSLLFEAASRLDRTLDGFGPRVAEQLLRYDWPGNVRELRNAMEHCAVLARGSRVELGDLPAEISHTASPLTNEVSSVRPLREIEKEYILAALASNGGNQTRTAGQLQIGVATLYRKLKSYRAAGTAELDKRR